MTYGVIFCHDKKFHFFANLTSRVCCSSKTTISLLQFYTRCFGKAWICHCHDATMKVQFSFFTKEKQLNFRTRRGQQTPHHVFLPIFSNKFLRLHLFTKLKKVSRNFLSFLRSNIFRLFDFVAYSDIWIFMLKITLKILRFEYFEFLQKF